MCMYCSHAVIDNFSFLLSSMQPAINEIFLKVFLLDGRWLRASLLCVTGRPLIRYKPMSGEPRPHEFPTSAVFSHTEDFGMLYCVLYMSE